MLSSEWVICTSLPLWFLYMSWNPVHDASHCLLSHKHINAHAVGLPCFSLSLQSSLSVLNPSTVGHPSPGCLHLIHVLGSESSSCSRYSLSSLLLCLPCVHVDSLSSLFVPPVLSGWMTCLSFASCVFLRSVLLVGKHSCISSWQFGDTCSCSLYS